MVVIFEMTWMLICFGDLVAGLRLWLDRFSSLFFLRRGWFVVVIFEMTWMLICFGDFVDVGMFFVDSLPL